MQNTFQVSGKISLLKRYRKASTANHYIQNRFQDALWQMAHQKQIEFIDEFLSQHKPRTLLDLACGPARVSSDISEKYFTNGVAADANVAMLAVAKARLGKKWTTKKVDAFALPFAKNSFDCVVSFRFLRHFALYNRKKLYTQIKHVLKPGGYLCIDVLNTHMLRGSYIEKFTGCFDKSIYDQTYTQEEIKKEMNSAGFTFVQKKNILNNWKLLLQNKKSVKQMKQEDEKDSNKNFMWITLWQKK